MKRCLLGLIAVCLVASLAPATAAPKLVRLAKDPAGDAPPGLDLTYLEVGADKRVLEIRIGVDMLPVLAGYPELPGIEWTFDVGKRTFVAEAAIVGGEPAFFLFELKGKAFTQVAQPKGTYSADDGYIAIHVPYSDIGARPGMTISGTGAKGTEDVDSHIHAGAVTHYPDYAASTKDFVLP